MAQFEQATVLRSKKVKRYPAPKDHRTKWWAVKVLDKRGVTPRWREVWVYGNIFTDGHVDITQPGYLVEEKTISRAVREYERKVRGVPSLNSKKFWGD